MEAAISESLFEKQESSFNMLNRVFVLLFSDINLLLIIIIIIIINAKNFLERHFCGSSINSF